MSTLRVLIVDDEPRARQFLRKMMMGEPDVEIVGECANGYEAIRQVRATRPDVMFLDVQMPELDGFDVLKKLHGAQMPALVFVTAYEKYALRAFEEHALDYLLKPFDRERFSRTLQRVRTESHLGQKERLAALLAQISEPATYLARMVVKHDGRMRLLATGDIECFESEDNYVRLYSGGDSYLVRETLGRLEMRLDPMRFIRVHRRALINVERLKEIQTGFHGEYYLLLASGKQLTLSRTYRDSFFKKFGHKM
jgi:two-component system, LytTR family, response regulator